MFLTASWGQTEVMVVGIRREPRGVERREVGRIHERAAGGGCVLMEKKIALER